MILAEINDNGKKVVRYYSDNGHLRPYVAHSKGIELSYIFKFLSQYRDVSSPLFGMARRHDGNFVPLQKYYLQHFFSDSEIKKNI
ncbi:MAG: hypothetical protein LBN01_04345 [Endomicrobium sp.]|jgi:hypothetical protein|nr:hypothetical protein [Endomicrobium sp.]